MTFDEICSFGATAATIASALGVPYASDVAAALKMEPQIVADFKEASAIVEDVWNGKPGQLLAQHVAAIQAVAAHPQFTSYQGQRGRNMHSAVPGQV